MPPKKPKSDVANLDDTAEKDAERQRCDDLLSSAFATGVCFYDNEQFVGSLLLPVVFGSACLVRRTECLQGSWSRSNSNQFTNSAMQMLSRSLRPSLKQLAAGKGAVLSCLFWEVFLIWPNACSAAASPAPTMLPVATFDDSANHQHATKLSVHPNMCTSQVVLVWDIPRSKHNFSSLAELTLTIMATNSSLYNPHAGSWNTWCCRSAGKGWWLWHCQEEQQPQESIPPHILCSDCSKSWRRPGVPSSYDLTNWVTPHGAHCCSTPPENTLSFYQQVPQH